MKSILPAVLLIAMLLPPAALGADESVAITPDVVYGHKDGMALTFDVLKPKENANGAGVLFMVSGGWYSHWFPPQHAVGTFKPLLDAGFTVFVVRHGSSPKYVVPEAVEDVRRSVRVIRQRARQFGVDPDRLGVTGGSAGGHLSLILGTTADAGDPQAGDEVLRQSSRVAAVVAYYPPTDLREFVQEDSWYYEKFPALRFDPARADACSPLLQVTDDDAPTLLVHGDKDELVPLDHSEKILAALQKVKVPCELLVVEGAAHGFSGDDGRRAGEAMVAWFQKHLGKPAATKREP
ncbi:MAG: alpha/beta hydrolase [Pirellulales bacterium]|nr:alpha/beta hydrolase [Pirellulales bacterium]